MNNSLQEVLRRLLNEELIRRLVTKYFVTKGIAKENFEAHIYPPIMQDIVQMVPQLSDLIEVEASVKDFHPSGRVKLSWNLFALGNQRMALGESSHSNLSELKQVQLGFENKKSAIRSASPKSIIEFIAKVLGTSEGGVIDPKQNKSSAPGSRPEDTGPGGSSTFYAGSQGFERNKPVL